MTAVTTTLRHHRSPTPATFRYLDYAVHGHGFDAVSFARAVTRALDEGVGLAPTDRPETHVATRPGSPRIYVVTTRTCTCQAGQHRRPCKHVALPILHLAVTRPRAP